MTPVQSTSPRSQSLPIRQMPKPPEKVNVDKKENNPAAKAQLQNIQRGSSELDKIEQAQKEVQRLYKSGKAGQAKAEYDKIVQRYEKLPLNSAKPNQSNFVKNVLASSEKTPSMRVLRMQASLAACGFGKYLGVYGTEGMDGKMGYFTRQALRAYQAANRIKNPQEVEGRLLAEARKNLKIQVQPEVRKHVTKATSTLSTKQSSSSKKSPSQGLKVLEKSRPNSVASKSPAVTPKSQFEGFVQKYNETLQTGREAMKFDPKSPEFVTTRQKFVKQVDATVAVAKQLGMSKEKVSQLVKDLFKPLVKENAVAINERSKEQKRDLARHYGLETIARNLSLEMKRDEPGNRFIREQIQLRKAAVSDILKKTA